MRAAVPAPPLDVYRRQALGLVELVDRERKEVVDHINEFGRTTQNAVVRAVVHLQSIEHA